MKILISNDDGIHATGIRALQECLADLADLVVVAPDRNRSGASNSLTLTSPLHVEHIAENIMSIDGTPTDCVHLAITGLLDERPDMVVSGINRGSNLGDDIMYSGTVAAAMEGRYLGLPALAFSLVGRHGCQHFDTAAHVAKEIVTKVIKNPLPADTILNVNIPDVSLSELDGFEITRLGARHIAERVTMRTDPRGATVYWIGAEGPAADGGPGTDFHAVQHNKVSITPLHLDLTHYQSFGNLADWAEKLNVSL
jgi:5'-nucleotidase